MSITHLTFSENVTSACEIHGLPKCVLCKSRPTAISDAAYSLTVGFVKRVLCGYFHLVPCTDNIDLEHTFLCDKNMIPNKT